jgi:hypothetical protein
MTTEEILALSQKNPATWTTAEEAAAHALLSISPEPLPEPYVELLFAFSEAEEARLRREGATSEDLDD